MQQQTAKASINHWEPWLVPQDLPTETCLKNMTATQASEVDWTAGHLRLAAALHQPKATDIDSNGMVNRESLQEACTLLLNIYRAKQHAEYILSRWCIQIKSTGSALCCHYGGGTSTKAYTSKVPPSKQRACNKSSDVNCPYYVPFSQLYNAKQMKDHNICRTLNPVRISPVVKLAH